jgi:hypothetical protein
MAKHQGGDAGFVAVFVHPPELCAGVLVGLGPALWLNVVAPFAGFVTAWGVLTLVNALAVALVAVLAVLLTTASTLLAADWRAEVASRQACAEIDSAAIELCLPAATVAPSQIDPRYLTATDSEALRHVFRAHRFTAPVFAPEADRSAKCTAPIVIESGGPIPAVAAAEAAPRIGHKIGTAATPELANARSTDRTAGAAPLSRGRGVAGSRSARPQVPAEPALGTARFVANGGLWLVCDRPLLRPPSNGQFTRVVVLSGDRGDRERRDFPGPSRCDGTVKSDARQGIWNGSRPPLGYKMVEAERRGVHAKKKLAIDPVEAETVRLAFRLLARELPLRRGLCRDQAAAYIGIGVTKFDEMVADGRMPRPKRIDARKVWDIRELDLAFDALPDDGNADEWSAPSL